MNQLLDPTNLTMTSQEIADLVGSRHDNVKKTIERLVERGVISHPPMQDGIPAANGIIPKLFIFNGEQGKRDSIVVVAQLSPEFTARLVDRWQELEGKAKPLSRLEWAKLQVRLLEDLERKEAEVAALRIELDESKQWSSVKRMEALHLRKFQWQSLMDWCDRHEVRPQKVFDQNYGTVNSYPAAAWVEVFGVEL